MDKSALLAVPGAFPEIRFAEMTTANVAADLAFEVEREGTLHALAGWVKVVVSEGIECTSSLLDETRMSWDNLLLPIESPTPVRAGDRVEVSIRANMVGKQSVFSWDVRVCGREFHQSSFQGMLLSKSNLEKAPLR